MMAWLFRPGRGSCGNAIVSDGTAFGHSRRQPLKYRKSRKEQIGPNRAPRPIVCVASSILRGPNSMQD
jgi:hypothetical protein